MDHPWLDTHIHVSNVGPDGSVRETMLSDLLDVLDRSGEDLRFLVSCDGPLTAQIIRDPQAMREVNGLIHELCRGRRIGCTGAARSTRTSSTRPSSAWTSASASGASRSSARCCST